MARRARRGDRKRGRRPRQRTGARAGGTRRDARRANPGRPDDPVRQHDRGRSAGAVSGRSRHRRTAPALHPLERDGDGGARQQRQQRPRRPRRDLLLGGDAVRYRIQSFLARSERDERRRSGVLPRPLVAGRVRARVSRGAHQRRAGRKLPPRSRRQRDPVVSASLAHARLLAVRDGLDGAGTAAGRLSGALHALPARPRLHRGQRPQGVVLRRRW